MVNKMGMATLCTDKEGAEQEAADAQMAWPHMGPHRAVQLVEAAQKDSFDHGPQATSTEEAARDVGKWLNERPNRPIDLRHVAMLCAHATAAHQQEAQEPVAWQYRSTPNVGAGWFECSKERAAQRAAHPEKWEVRCLYTAPQPSPAAQGDTLDAARSLFDSGWQACARFCDRDDVSFDGIVGDTGCPEFEAAFDAARAALEGKK